VTPIGNIKANLPPVLDALLSAELPDRATVFNGVGDHSSRDGIVSADQRGPSRPNISPSGHPFDLYYNRDDLGNTGAPDGANFRGRGFVQLTGRVNYTRYASEIGVDLATNPELGNDPQVAAKLLARFLGDREDRIRETLAANDLATARRLVNGGSNGLDRFTDAFKRGIELIPA
jgi:peptidoglycan L-alanyl-D-glutamate endopeptidase CwlK